MATSVIEIEVDELAARAYAAASLSERRRLQEAVAALLRAAGPEDTRSSVEIGRSCAEIAANRGMTEEVLHGLLDE